MFSFLTHIELVFLTGKTHAYFQCFGLLNRIVDFYVCRIRTRITRVYTVTTITTAQCIRHTISIALTTVAAVTASLNYE